MSEEENSTKVEQHIRTVAVGISLVLLTWVGVTLTQNLETLAAMDEKVKHMGADIQELKQQLNRATADRYTWKDAQSDKANINYRISALESRLDKLESKCETCFRARTPETP